MKNLFAHLVNPTLAAYFEANARLCDGALTVEIYGTDIYSYWSNERNSSSL